MKKRMVLLAAVFAVAAMFAGCGGDFPNLTEDQESVVGEYAAITLLKYDANSRSRLVNLSSGEETPEETEVQTPVSEPDVPSSEPEESDTVYETPVIEIGEITGADSFESYFELPDGVTLVYEREEICQSYSGGTDDFFSLEASEGKRLLVLHFALDNSSAADQKVDFLHGGDSYRVTVNGDYIRYSLPTLLLNDMSTYEETIAAGEEKDIVLLVEIEPEQAENLTSVSLNLKNESKTYTIQLLQR